MFQLPTLLTLCFLVPLAPPLAEVRDSTDLLTEPGLESPSDYGAVTTYPDWADVRNKPATATRWPRFNEVLDRPAYYPTTWSQISGKPEHFSPDEHEHDDRYLRLTGGSLSGTLRADRIGIGMHSGEAFLSIAGNRNERPDILFDSHGLIAANQNMTFVIEDDEIIDILPALQGGDIRRSATSCCGMKALLI